ncbi:MAG TPA: hypothetical protein ENK06_07840 [Gammaproteobacteria bacterium]|nr:hypothetical protein [Gammaproteobacteria bacterium]
MNLQKIMCLLRLNTPFFRQLSVNLLLIGVIILLSACVNEGGSTADNSSTSSASKTRISVSSNSVFLSKIGSQYQLSALLVDSAGTVLLEQPSFTWQSNAENIVKIDQAGLITAVALGRATVEVSGAGESKEISVEVSEENVTINGIARYEDKAYSSNGFVERKNYYKAIRFAKVDLLSESGGDVLQTTYTDANGNFSFTGALTSQQRISVYARTSDALGLDLQVKDRVGALYAVSKAVDLSDLNNFFVNISVAQKAVSAFNILDVFTNAAQFMMANTDAGTVTLTAFWQPNNDAGTYFCTGFDASYCLQGAGVYVYSAQNGDTDDFDDDVLYHEFGHYFADALSRDDSFGGCHLLSSKDLDLRLAWSEGFGDFFPVGVKSWLSDPARVHLLSSVDSLPATAYVDTYGSTAQIYIDLAVMSQIRYSSAANEMAIAKILWSLSERFGVPAVFRVLTDYLPTIGEQSVNLESFWDGWLLEYTPNDGELTTLRSIFNERLVYYQEDEFENDNLADELRKATLGVKETHYLYSDTLSTDVDVIAFDVEAGKQYTLKTSGLTSGADTHISVLNNGQNPLMVNGLAVENDDATANAYYSYDPVCGSSRVKNNATALSSEIVFTAQTTGIYYAKVRTTTDTEPFLAAGRYGTYDFQVKQN